MNTLLFTGGSGFLGKNILPKLQSMFENVTTLGQSKGNDIQVNLAHDIPEFPQKFDIVLHAAGKAHIIPETKEEEDLFYDVNYEGTRNLCKALEKVGVPKSFIFISTVAVYGCEEGSFINEDTPLKGSTPYAKSKIMAEEFLQVWCAKNNVILTILRPSLIAGINPPGNLGAMISGIKKGFYFNIGGGKAQKSVLMAEDIANLIPLVKDKGGIYNVCDNENPTFGELSLLIANQLGKSAPISIPYPIAKGVACMGDIIGKRFPLNSRKLRKITKPLTFSAHKAVNELSWKPLKVSTHLEVF